MKKTKKQIKKDRKHPGVKVYYIDDNLSLWCGVIESVGEKETICNMVKQHIAADKTPVKMSIPNNRLRKEE